MSVFAAIVWRELRRAWSTGGLLMPIAFFLLVAILFPFAIGLTLRCLQLARSAANCGRKLRREYFPRAASLISARRDLSESSSVISMARKSLRHRRHPRNKSRWASSPTIMQAILHLSRLVPRWAAADR